MKRMLALLLAAVLLSGCSLAVPGRTGRDDLSGFFITVEREIDGETMEVWDRDAAGMKMISDHDLAGEKLYASFIGNPWGGHYKFPEGCGLFGFTYAQFQDGEPWSRSSDFSPEIELEHFDLDLGEPLRFDMEAVLYATEDTKATIWVNPVYQDPDGGVYVLSDKPIGYQVQDGEGFAAILTQGEAEAQTRVRVRVEYVVLPESYVVIEMDGQDRPLRQTEFASGNLPESYSPGADAAYLLLEARAGENTVRTVHSPGDEKAELDTYYPGRYGFCIKGYTKIEWEGV